ncbi:Small RNA degrading nuclease 3 [Morella rubra]|uniref:Small RNA degrading nuclease 3 n=1 Tax=Morella rubra TaxID=262757 RepID=A0A6A1VVZ7_9ROSI|nr:Small RNA degrading nuclease 3 [Morella rubra]
MVKLAQKRGMKGTKGDWKEFLDVHDKKLGASLGDPSRRSNDVLAAFLKTFSKADDLKFFAQIMQCHSKREIVEQFIKRSPDGEIPEQRLVRLTLEHPQFPLDYSFPSDDEGWLVTKLSKKSKVMRSNVMLAVDCEMVLCEDGTEALVRVCIVDRDLQVKLDELVNPNKAVADYRTDITGVSATDLERINCSLADVQKSMKKLLSDGTILVGHSLNNDLRALKLDHARVIDTSFIFKYSDGSINRRPSLNSLCKASSWHVRKKGAPHNCLDDACAAMKLVLAKIEHGVEIFFPLVQEDVPESEMAKLLLHRIPNNVPTEELHKVIPGDFTIEVKPSKKARGERYSVLAIFKNPQEAGQAYESVKGGQEKDSSGRPQKLVNLKLSTGMIASLYVRKMAHDDYLGQTSSKKRVLQAEETQGVSKKLQTHRVIEEATSNHCNDNLETTERLKQELSNTEMADSNRCCDHLEEIERLKQDLRKRDFQITAQDNIIADLKKRLKSGHGKRQ